MTLSTLNHSPRYMLASSPSIARGFSLVEVVMLIAVLGVLATVAVTMVGSQRSAVSDTKLSSDISTLNHHVVMYLSDGGSLTGLTNPQTVLDKLKRSRAQTDWQTHTGAVSGRLLDTRLKAIITNAANTSGSPRAKWNSRTERFEITTGGGQAVTEFLFDEALRNTEYGTDTTRRVGRVKYNGNTRGWVWGGAGASSSIAYQNPGNTGGDGTTDLFDPDEVVPVTPPPDSGGDGGGGPVDGGGGSGGGSPPAPVRLPLPNITPAGGTYTYSAFPTSITVSPNGAPGGTTSQLRFQKNGGGWEPYLGVPIFVLPSDVVVAKNFTLNTATYTDSSSKNARFYRLVSGFTGTSTGTWGNATGGSGLLTETANGVDNSTFKHGNTKLDLGNGEFLDAGTENVLSFTRKPFDTIIPNTWFPLGGLVMLNGTTFYNSEADGVTLSINLNLSDPVQAGVVHVNLGLISTENTSDRTASADIVELRNPSTDFTVQIEGVTYRLELGWTTLDPGAGVPRGNQFLVYEGSSANAELRARFVSDR